MENFIKKYINIILLILLVFTIFRSCSISNRQEKEMMKFNKTQTEKYDSINKNLIDIKNQNILILEELNKTTTILNKLDNKKQNVYILPTKQ